MLKRMDLKDLCCNPCTMFGTDWALLTAGDRERYNTMTVGWAGLGTLWSRPVAMIYVRPQRYTYEFTEEYDFFTLTHFAPGEGREAMKLCGSVSGRDVDKFKAAGLTPAFAECGAPYAAEGDLVLVCRKLYAQDMTAESFLDRDVRACCYPGEDYHRMYVGEIIEAYGRE